MLELGCGIGINIIPMAHTYPRSTFVGIDLSGHAIGDGLRTIEHLGLTNIASHQRDILVEQIHSTRSIISSHTAFILGIPLPCGT